MNDVATKKTLWWPGDVFYYEKEASDSDYCTLRFTSEKADIIETFALVMLSLNQKEKGVKA
jgi:general stress protein 26